MKTTKFQADVYAAVRDIPRGETRSYGEVAEAVGSESAARAVGQALSLLEFESDIPWWRVVMNDGSFPGSNTQFVADLLAVEGVAFTNDGRVAGYTGSSSGGSGSKSRSSKEAVQEPCGDPHQTVQSTCRWCNPLR